VSENHYDTIYVTKGKISQTKLMYMVQNLV